MEKLELDLDTLSVRSFATTAKEANKEEGTVRGAQLDDPYECMAGTCQDSEACEYPTLGCGDCTDNTAECVYPTA